MLWLDLQVLTQIRFPVIHEQEIHEQAKDSVALSRCKCKQLSSD
jgi:hypothetical protein